MPDVSGMAAFELSHPVLLLVLMEADNAALHGGSLVAQRSGSAAARRAVRRSRLLEGAWGHSQAIADALRCFAELLDSIVLRL